MPKKKRMIRLCPKCQKPTLKAALNVSGWLAPDMFECTEPECTYIGGFYVEVDPEDFKLNESDLKEIEKNKKTEKE